MREFRIAWDVLVWQSVGTMGIYFSTVYNQNRTENWCRLKKKHCLHVECMPIAFESVCVRAQRYLRRKCRYNQVNDSIESKSHKSPDFIDIFNWRAPNQIDLPGSIKCSMTLKWKTKVNCLTFLIDGIYCTWTRSPHSHNCWNSWPCWRVGQYSWRCAGVLWQIGTRFHSLNWLCKQTVH